MNRLSPEDVTYLKTLIGRDRERYARARALLARVRVASPLVGRSMSMTRSTSGR